MYKSRITIGTLLLLITFLFPSVAFAADNEKGKTVKLNAANYKEETAKGVVLVDYWAVWCGPCRKLAPVMDEIAADKDLNIKVGKLNVDENKALTTKQKISSIPTMILYKDGKEITRFVGVYPKYELLKNIEKALKD